MHQTKEVTVIVADPRREEVDLKPLTKKQLEKNTTEK